MKGSKTLLRYDLKPLIMWLLFQPKISKIFGYFLVIGIRKVDRRQGIVASDPVLDGQNRGGGRTVLKKKGIMAHAQAQQA